MALTVINYNENHTDGRHTETLENTAKIMHAVQFERGFVVIRKKEFVPASKLTSVGGDKANPQDKWVEIDCRIINSNLIDDIRFVHEQKE